MATALRIVAIVAAFNEEDIIGSAVRALIDEGVSVYLLDNHSTDRTVAEVEPLRGRGVIGIETFPAEAAEASRSFAWERILRRKEELAQTLDADWFIHHDADEFRESPWPGETLGDGIARADAAGYNAIDFQVLTFWPTPDDLIEAADVRERLRFYEPGQTFDRQQIKCWKRSRQPVSLAASGGHSAQFAGRRIFPVRFLLRHYPIRGQAHGVRKVLQERVPRFLAVERAKGWHVQYDALAESRAFIRDAGALRRYDPDAVRVDLLCRHRGVERLERVLATTQDLADRLTDENVALRGLLRDRDAALAELLDSRSWKWSAPVRRAERLIRDHAPASMRRRFEVEREARRTAATRLGASLPLAGVLRLASDVEHYWDDRWAGPTLEFRAVATRRTREILIAGVVPHEVAAQDLTLTIDQRAFAHHAAAGAFEWRVPVRLDPQREIQFRVAAARSWRPSAVSDSADHRDLAWHVVRIAGR